ncbi:hypothetical protein ACRRTK_001091 [Alexandromys fortis]
MEVISLKPLLQLDGFQWQAYLVLLSVPILAEWVHMNAISSLEKSLPQHVL